MRRSERKKKDGPRVILNGLKELVRDNRRRWYCCKRIMLTFWQDYDRAKSMMTKLKKPDSEEESMPQQRDRVVTRMRSSQATAVKERRLKGKFTSKNFFTSQRRYIKRTAMLWTCFGTSRHRRARGQDRQTKLHVESWKSHCSLATAHWSYDEVILNSCFISVEVIMLFYTDGSYVQSQEEKKHGWFLAHGSTMCVCVRHVHAKSTPSCDPPLPPLDVSVAPAVFTTSLCLSVVDVSVYLCELRVIAC